MDTLKVNAVINEYITNFDMHNIDNDEGYKWVATGCFKKYWNLDAADMLGMFTGAMKEMSNLIDNSQVQPLGGIRLLLSQPDEVEFVRDSFRTLFSEDGGDIDARQKRVDNFIEKVNARIALYTPEGAWKYNQNRTSVIYYLNLDKPDGNYIFKATEANDWANCSEFGEDIGSGASFSLAKYYRMCDELLEFIKDNQTLQNLNAERVEDKFKNSEIARFDDKNHILVYDIMYCAYHYLFYDKAAVTKKSTKERLRRAGLRKQRDELNLLQDQKQNDLDSIPDDIPVPDIVGTAIMHKKFGTGKVTEIDDKNIIADFNGEVKKFQYPGAFIDGFLSTSTAGFLEAIQSNAKLSSVRAALKAEIESLDTKIAKIDKELGQ